jgi:sulfate transport system permease protein
LSAPEQARAPFLFRTPSAIPGFPLTFAFTGVFLLLIVLFPLATLIGKASGLGVSGFIAILSERRVISALEVSFGLSLVSALVSGVVGIPIAWALTRYDFLGRRWLDAIVDLPFALPTAVAGIALSTLYATNGWFGAALAKVGITVAFTRLGIVVAMVFVGFPFVVRTLQPLIETLEVDLEEASASLGAGRLRTLWRVVLPPLVPAILTGIALAFARGVGEYGSVIFIAGNLAGKTEIAPLLIVEKLEAFDYRGATAIATIMLAISFLGLLTINRTQAWTRRRLGDV